MEIELTGGRKGTVSNGAEIAAWLDELSRGTGETAILSSGTEYYVQAALDGGGYVVEKREGGDDRHYRAVRTRPPVAGPSAKSTLFVLDDVQLIFEDYLAGRDSASFLHWRKMTLTRPLPSAGRRLALGLLILAISVVVAIAGVALMGGFSA